MDTYIVYEHLQAKCFRSGNAYANVSTYELMKRRDCLQTGEVLRRSLVQTITTIQC